MFELGELPKQHNNPFAIIQPDFDPWLGLEGKTESGFLIFKDPKHGVRAGFINLVNAYLERGLDTIEEIFPVYAPYGHGSNDPAVYIKRVEQLSGINRKIKIETPDQIYRIGKAIVTHEEGSFWLSQEDFDEGFRMAMDRVDIKTVAKAGMGILGLAGVCFGIYLVLKMANDQPKPNKNK